MPDDDDDAVSEEEISPKKMIKILNRSRKYLKRSSDELANALRKAAGKKTALPTGE